MKTRIVILASMFLMCVLVNAQIKRNIDGAELGKTTKSEVISLLAQKNHYYEMKEDGNAIQSREEFSFGGVIWSGVYYSFYKDTLERVTYSKIVKSKEKALREKYKELRNNLYKKYVKRTPKDNSNDYSPETKIKDKSTFIKLSIQHHSKWPGIMYLVLTYKDLKLESKKKKQNIDDL